MVDKIDWNNLQHKYNKNQNLARGIWEWGFFYKEINLSPEEILMRDYSSKPYT